ncbi:hypothetical protein Tco_0621600 [Tanacetum coccineum]
MSHLWSIRSLKESLWVKWIHTYKLKGRTLWEIPLRDMMSGMVCKHLTSFIDMPNVLVSLSLIVDFLTPLASKRTAISVTVKLVFAASCYFIWQERNNRADFIDFGSEFALGYAYREECQNNWCGGMEVGSGGGCGDGRWSRCVCGGRAEVV